MEKAQRRAIILGLDGATFDVLLPRIERGQMPNLAVLLQQAVWGGLQSTTPPFSAQAWVSMATGKPRASTKTIIFTPFQAFVLPIPSPPPLALAKVPSMKHSYSR